MKLILHGSRKILIPDVPPPTAKDADQGLIIAGIGILCASVMIAAVVFVFLGT